jgi:hypothetical protein
MRKIRITAGEVSAIGFLDDNETADAIWNALPIEARVNTWGDEIYFEIPVILGLAEDARDLVEMGELGYWPTGNAFCIFFGPTPASRGEEIRAASAVNVFGQVVGDAGIFKQVDDGVVVKIEQAAITTGP